jgi:glycosyltransferase involved in cell wall biosynthesis
LRSDVDAGLQGAAARDDSLAADAAETAGRVEHLERQADLATMTRWLEAAPVADDLLISVVLPTCNRRPLLEEAIASVQAQSYQRWELVVVDDDSTDGTAEFLAASNDPRVRAVDNRGRGHAAACNTALELLHGDVVVHLDDDNRFDRHWLKAVAATFGALPGTTVAYGARICDDHGRVHRGESSGRPWLQFRGWDAEAMRAFNIADMNVLAHRPSEIRLDEALSYFTDWDLFLHLTRDVTPVEIPAVAAYYRTDVEDRMTDRVPQERKQRDYETIRRKFEASAST